MAEEIEESLANVARSCEAVMQCGMVADTQEIYEKLQRNHSQRQQRASR